MQSPHTAPTALLLIDLQLGLTHPTFYGPSRSTPTLESNLTTLLSTVRHYNTTNPQSPIHIIHIHHQSLNPSSPLHPSATVTWSTDANISGRRGIDAIPSAQPRDGEPVLWKTVNSAFYGTDLEERIRGLAVKQVVVVGTTIEHCVGTSVRMAANMNLVGDVEGKGERGVVLVEDGVAAFAKCRDGRVVWDAETVWGVEVESLREEFAVVVGTEKVVRVIGEVNGGK